MPAGVEGGQIRDACSPGGNHGEQRHWRVDTLTMHEVPSALSDHSRNPGGEVIVSSTQPGWDTQDRDTVNDVLPWQPPGPVCCEHCDFEGLQRRKATRNLIDVRLSPTDLRKVTWADHEHAEWPLQRPAPSIAERFTGSYVTHHDLSASPSEARLAGFGDGPESREATRA